MTLSADRHGIITSRERLWYPEPSRQALLEELYAIATDPARHRTRSIAIIAESNGGKSALVQRYLTQHPPVRGKNVLELPAIRLNMTTIPRVEELSVALLEALGAPDARAGNHASRLTRFVQLARRMKVNLIFLDEFHDCADTTGRGKPFLRCIKGLINEGLCVVPVGTEELAAVLARDPQLATRFNFARGRLTRLQDPGIVKAMMLRISGLPESQVSDAAVEFVLRESRGILGHTLDLIEGTLLAHGDLKLASLRQHRALMDVLDRVV